MGDIGRTMKVIILCLLLGTTLGAPGGPTFEEFEESLNEKFLDPKEEAAAKEEFAKHEAQVEENNADYEAGNSNYKEEVEPWDDQSDQEFEKEKEGLLPIDDMTTRGMGLIITPEHERINTPEEIAFFDEIYAKYDRADKPATWDSRAKGFVSPVRNQGGCGSCAAFAAVGAAESSLLKAGAAAATLDLAEQWLVDCKPDGCNGCNGASLHGYQEYMAKEGKLMHETGRPYLGKTEFQCPAGPYWSPGYKITKAPTQWDPSDDQIMAHVMEFGATAVALYASDPGFGHYKSGVFDTCNNDKVNHAVLIVGWGTENNIPYWLIKNSWGSSWGDAGYIKIKKGTCYINKYGSAPVVSEKTTGQADPVGPTPTPAPSADCDMNYKIGPFTGNKEFYHNDKKVTAVCHAGKCMVPGVENSCIAICGKDPCSGGDSPSPPPSACDGSCKYKQYKGDNYCDDGNNNCGCDYDGGDCCGSNVNKKYCQACKCLDPNHKPACEGTCEFAKYKGDSWCDDGNNNCGCEYDGGDCCGSNVKTKYCKACKCLDPKA